MLKKCLILLSLVLMNHGFSQSEQNLKEINQIWFQFYKAFETLDHTIMDSIHSKDLVRISGGERISDHQSYINGYKERFKRAKEKGSTNHISLRFFERIGNSSIASERGVYQLIINKGQSDEQIYYGQFHVIFRRENGAWKILMDYDSNKNNAIGSKEYLKSFAIDSYGNFINNP